jgi:hypothetical protein
MSIKLVQAVSAPFPGAVGPSYKAQPTLTGVAAGNTIVVASSLLFQPAGNTTIAVTDAQGAYTDLTPNVFNNYVANLYALVDIAILSNVSAGTHAITSQAGPGTFPGGAAGYAVAMEFSGIVTASPLDKIASSAGNAVAATGSTANVASTNEVAVAVLAFPSSTTTAIASTNGYSNAYTQSNGQTAGLKVVVDYLTPVPNGPQSDAWAFIGNYAAAIVVLKGSGSGGGSTPSSPTQHRLTLLGVGA